MNRCLSVVVGVVMLLSWAAFTLMPQPGAQAAAPADMAAHPVVGMWRTTVNNTGDPPSISFTTFHPDGTYLEVVQEGGLVVTGLWQPTDERTATVTAYVFFAIDDRPVEGEVRLTVQVDETGATLTEAGRWQCMVSA